MTPSDLKRLRELAEEWKFYASRFGIVAEVSNGRWTDEQLAEMSTGVLGLLDSIAAANAECERLRGERDGWQRACEIHEDSAKRNAASLAKLDAVLDKNEALQAALAEACDIADEGNEEIAANAEDDENCAITRKRIATLRALAGGGK